jgi:hypothetical protein
VRCRLELPQGHRVATGNALGIASLVKATDAKAETIHRNERVGMLAAPAAVTGVQLHADAALPIFLAVFIGSPWKTP